MRNVSDLRRLMRERPAEAVGAAEKSLTADSVVVRREAVRCLRELGDDRAVDELRTSLQDPDSQVVALAAQALGELCDPSDRTSVDMLIALIGDEHWHVRQRAAFSLGQLADERAVPSLASALQDDSATVQRAAAWALGQIRVDASHAALAGAAPTRLRTRLAVTIARRGLEQPEPGSPGD